MFGTEPYFDVPGYFEFRLGDHQHELGVIDAAYAPPGATDCPGGAIVFWHVDDLDAALTRLLERGAVEYQPVTVRGVGFVTASVVDPFGNIVGIISTLSTCSRRRHERVSRSHVRWFDSVRGVESGASRACAFDQVDEAGRNRGVRKSRRWWPPSVAPSVSSRDGHDDTPEGTLANDPGSRPVGDDPDDDVVHASSTGLGDESVDSLFVTVEALGDDGFGKIQVG